MVLVSKSLTKLHGNRQRRFKTFPSSTDEKRAERQTATDFNNFKKGHVTVPANEEPEYQNLHAFMPQVLKGSCVPEIRANKARPIDFSI